MKKNLNIFMVIVLVILQQCNNHASSEKYDINLLFKPQIDSILSNFSENIIKGENISIFVVLKNIDAGTLKIYIIAKKSIRSDFDFIGQPTFYYKKDNKSFYFYTGMEKLLLQDTTFWDKHPEIYDDRLKQLEGLYETPILKKALYILKDNQLQDLQPFDDLIFIKSPMDSIKFH